MSYNLITAPVIVDGASLDPILNGAVLIQDGKIISEVDGFIILEIMSNYDSNNRFFRTIEKIAEVIAVARSGPLALAKGKTVTSL